MNAIAFFITVILFSVSLLIYRSSIVKQIATCILTSIVMKQGPKKAYLTSKQMVFPVLSMSGIVM